MNSWFVWTALVLTGITLGLVGYHFSLRCLRVVAVLATLATVIYITRYGMTYQAQHPGRLSDAFTRGADALSIALFHTHAAGHIPGPGRIVWLIIAVLLVVGYRELEAWTLHWQARSLDTSALVNPQHHVTQDDDEYARRGKQRHDQLAEQLKYRLPAVEVRSPAILPGGNRPSALASIAEASGVDGSGLAGAIIRFFGMLWPSPRQIQVRVWLEQTPDKAENHFTRVTVGLQDPRTGERLATNTLVASQLDDAASVVAGYVAQHIFAEDRTAPPWCTGAADGSDLAALQLARQTRVYPESERNIRCAMDQQIRILERVANRNLCAGVPRYELAQLYDLTGKHVEALRLHAINRERYPRFYRGRYRLAMSLEMIANPDLALSLEMIANPGPDPEKQIKPAEVLNEALTILYQSGVPKAHKRGARKRELIQIDKGTTVLSREQRRYLLDAAWDELQDVRRYLTLPKVIWWSFLHRDERGILKPYMRQRHRQAFQDGVCFALLLVAVRRALINKEPTDPATAECPEDDTGPDSAFKFRRAGTIRRIATAIAGQSQSLALLLEISSDRPGKTSDREAPPVIQSLRTRRWPGQCRTRSWQAAYNLACAYAVMAQHCMGKPQAHKCKSADERPAGEADETEKHLCDLVSKVITSLKFAINNPECEMDRSWNWINCDPDFGRLRSGDEAACAEFNKFLTTQKQRDYPVQRQDLAASAMGTDAAVERHDGTPPGEDEIAARMRAEGLSPHGWGNGPGDTYGWHEHGYEKVLYCVRGRIVFHTAGGDIELGPGDKMILPPHTAHAATVGAEGVRCIEAPASETRAG